jgi:hypothetical protein
MQNGNTLSIKLLIVLMTIFGVASLEARDLESNGNSNKGGDNPTPTAGCSPASAVAILQFNNVRARLEATGGTFFQNRSVSPAVASYNVPKQQHEDDPVYTAIYAAGLWIGGEDLNSNLKTAIAMFRGGNDFFPGPLDKNTADVDAETCNIFDQYFSISRAEVNAFVAWHANPSAYPGYTIPKSILNYPGFGNTIIKQAGQSYYVSQDLAPFYDKNGDGFYNPNDGDYPYYDLIGDIDCRTTRDVRLFGDTTIWFVFNDKGNAHTESSGQPIGMEIHGQAFAFATNDEINDMTFYNYELINRSSFTFTNTYFGQWVDADLGNYGDDYVGCDASRGLGYAYNGDNDDESSSGTTGYGSTPPAIGVDFFEGPYADNDGLDNPLTQNIQDAIDSNGIPYDGLGIGYGDGIIDNERYGMKKFVYYSSTGGAPGDGDPNVAADFYNYLQGNWKGTTGQMVWGGDGNPLGTGQPGKFADLIFPGDSDPYFWSTGGVPQTPAVWSEVTENNPPADRRFLQSAGPFTLKPGAVNDLTIGIVYARALSGNNTASLTYLKVADDKAQALFDNCFKVLEGPNTPDVTIQELENELVLYLSNSNPISNNFAEGAHLKDATISIPDTLNGVWQGPESDRDTLKYYDFQGYQIYQVKTSSIAVTQLSDPSVARLIAQVDKKDGIGQLVNYEFDKTIQANVPTLMVSGEDKGIRHTFRVTKDAFATGSDNKLVNHKTYHFIAIAYAHNNWMSVDPNNFTLGGQLKPYLSSRTNSTGSGIKAVSAIPHDPSIEDNGTLLNSQYGDQPEVTRIEGQGNGGLRLELTSASEATIVSSNFINYPTYQAGYGPIEVKVIDPLNVAGGTYILQFLDSTTNYPLANSIDDAYWRLIYPSSNGFDTVMSDVTIAANYEQMFLDQGLSITLKQPDETGVDDETGGYITSSLSYSNPEDDWLYGVTDVDGETELNWIRSGVQTYDVPSESIFSVYNDYQLFGTSKPLDANQNFENILDGTWAPYPLVAAISSGVGEKFQLSSANLKNAPSILSSYLFGPAKVPYYYSNVNTSSSKTDLSHIQSVDIVFTSDKSKWTRSVVFETGSDTNLTENNAKLFYKRKVPSVNKNFTPDGTTDIFGNPSIGMSWFPGYAINIETGERLNIAFGEDSGLPQHNGRDMKMNPTTSLVEGTMTSGNFTPTDTVLGGRHYVYIINERYDECKWLDSILSRDNTFPGGTTPNAVKAINKQMGEKVIWAGIPMTKASNGFFGQFYVTGVGAQPNNNVWLSSDARVKLRVEKPYRTFETANSNNAAPVGNQKRPMYQFNMDGFAAENNQFDIAKDKLATIRAVPNPYYAYSEYESDKLDTRVKITNLPEECTVSIYNASGTLMRVFEKSDPKTSLDWDLKNTVGIPVAGGVYLIHIEVPEIGEKIIKWYGVTRPTDLGGF